MINPYVNPVGTLTIEAISIRHYQYRLLKRKIKRIDQLRTERENRSNDQFIGWK